jgi:hypothetical protein
MPEWTPQETSTHQHHVIAHVVGATVLGYFHADEAVHLVLDIGFVWTVYLDGEMGLLPDSLAVSDLETDAGERAVLASDVRLLHEDGSEAHALRRATRAPRGCLVEEVEFYTCETGCRLLIRGEESSLVLETLLARRSISVEASERAASQNQS